MTIVHFQTDLAAERRQPVRRAFAQRTKFPLVVTFVELADDDRCFTVIAQVQAMLDIGIHLEAQAGKIADRAHRGVHVNHQQYAITARREPVQLERAANILGAAAPLHPALLLMQQRRVAHGLAFFVDRQQRHGGVFTEHRRCTALQVPEAVGVS